MEPIDGARAVEHLAAADPVIGRLIAMSGPFSMRPDADDPFRSLARAIIFQQLSGKAAGTIYDRFVALFDLTTASGTVRRTDPAWSPLGQEFPAPGAVLAMGEDRMRGAGLSRQKVAAVQSLAEHFAAGELGREQFDSWADEEIISHLTRVRGIGRWTAEMFLMFHLHRPDVLPVNDVGINRAIMKQYGLPSLPVAAEVQAIGAPWRPWATVACWYLWRSEDVRLMTPDA